MTEDRDEGKAALEAAADALVASLDAGDGPEDRAKAAIRAWLKALPGWWLVPVGLTPEMMAAGCERVGSTQMVETLWWAIQRDLPPPPGLEPDSEQD